MSPKPMATMKFIKQDATISQVITGILDGIQYAEQQSPKQKKSIAKAMDATIAVMSVTPPKRKDWLIVVISQPVFFSKLSNLPHWKPIQFLSDLFPVRDILI